MGNHMGPGRQLLMRTVLLAEGCVWDPVLDWFGFASALAQLGRGYGLGGWLPDGQAHQEQHYREKHIHVRDQFTEENNIGW